MDKNLMFANSNQATMDNPNQSNEMHEFPIYTVFIDHPEAKILFDTACNPNAMGDNGRWITVTQKRFHTLLTKHVIYLIDLNKLA